MADDKNTDRGGGQRAAKNTDRGGPASGQQRDDAVNDLFERAAQLGGFLVVAVVAPVPGKTTAPKTNGATTQALLDIAATPRQRARAPQSGTRPVPARVRPRYEVTSS